MSYPIGKLTVCGLYELLLQVSGLQFVGMAKRSASSMSAINKSLTGGTGDVNPQWFRFAPDQSTVVNSIIAQVAPTPLAAFNNVPGNKAVVMEVLKVAFAHAPTWGNLTNISNQAQWKTSLLAGTRPTSDINLGWGAPTVISFNNQVGTTASTVTTQYTGAIDTSVVVDLTDGAGHGVLLAANQVTWLWQEETLGLQTNTSNEKSCAFLYRFKEVSLQEYMGIIQSQQTPSGNF